MSKTHRFYQSKWGYVPWYITILGIFIAIPLRRNTFIEIENDVIRGNIGVFNKRTLHTKINNQISIDVRQGVWGRLFDYGHITIIAPTGEYRFKYMKDPNKIVDLIISKQ